jgi:hypothetical protein
MGPAALLPLRRQACCRFIALENLSPSAGLKPMNLTSGDKHANHYTVEDDWDWRRSIRSLQSARYMINS